MVLPEPTADDNRYGELASNFYQLDAIANKPKAGDIWKNTNAMLWYDASNRLMEFIFWNSPVTESSTGMVAAYTNRFVNVTYTCNAHEVTHNGDGSFNNITVANVGIVMVDSVVPNSITYFANEDNWCSEDGRCSIVQAFEASNVATPWYYTCNVTMGKTQNDPNNITWISDQMAYFATSSIAQTGYVDFEYQEFQIYPNKSNWGAPASGDGAAMGWRMTSFALGAIAGAAIFNPTKNVTDIAPIQAFQLTLNHPGPFYLIIGLICGCQLFFIIVVAVLSNRVKVGPDSHLSMSLMLRPIAESLEGVSGGRENKAYKNAKKSYHARYEKSRTGRWVLSMS